jgi:hypothetical protein
VSKAKWTSFEEDIIIENYENMSITELKTLLPDRNKKSILRKIEEMRRNGDLGYKYNVKDKRPGRKKGNEWDDGWSDSWDDTSW